MAILAQLLLLAVLVAVVAFTAKASKATKLKVVAFTAKASKATKLKLVFTIGGAIIGLMIVRGFMLDAMEEMGWRMFWDGLFKGRLRERDMEIVFQSATFMKSVVGLVVGGIVGMAVATRYLSSTRKDGQ